MPLPVLLVPQAQHSSDGSLPLLTLDQEWCLHHAVQTEQRFLQAPPARCGFLTDCILFKSTIRHLWNGCGFGTLSISCQEESVIWLCSLDGAPQRSLLNNGKSLFCHAKPLKSYNSLVVAWQILLLQFLTDSAASSSWNLWAFSGSCLPCWQQVILFEVQGVSLQCCQPFYSISCRARSSQWLL